MAAVTRKQAPSLVSPKSSEKKSKWAQAFEEARATPGAWRRVTFPLAKSTVTQVASDIRNAHKRPRERRMAGIEGKERWDATWDEKGGKFFVFIRYPDN